MKVLIYTGLTFFSLTTTVFHVPFSLFTYHPLLILIALISITEGIAGISDKRIVNANDKNYHGIFQGVGMTAMTFGFSVIYYNKDLNAKPHFTSTHGKLGSITVIFMFLQLLVGITMTYFSKSRMMYKYHRISGYLLFLLLWITSLLGVQTSFLITNDYLPTIYYTSVLLLTIGISSQLQFNKLKLI